MITLHHLLQIACLRVKAINTPDRRSNAYVKPIVSPTSVIQWSRNGGQRSICPCPCALFDIVSSSVHIIVFFLIVVHWWRWLLLFQKFLAIKRTCGVQLQPGLDAIEIETMLWVAG